MLLGGCQSTKTDRGSLGVAGGEVNMREVAWAVGVCMNA